MTKISIPEVAEHIYQSELRRDSLERVAAAEEGCRPESMSWSRKAYVECLQTIRDSGLTSRDWLDTDRGDRIRNVDRLLDITWADPACHDVDIAFLNAEKDTQNTLVDATIGWAMEDVYRGAPLPLRGSKEWTDLARAVAGALLDAQDTIRERDDADAGRS